MSFRLSPIEVFFRLVLVPGDKTPHRWHKSIRFAAKSRASSKVSSATTLSGVPRTTLIFEESGLWQGTEGKKTQRKAGWFELLDTRQPLTCAGRSAHTTASTVNPWPRS